MKTGTALSAPVRAVIVDDEAPARDRLRQLLENAGLAVERNDTWMERRYLRARPGSAGRTHAQAERLSAERPEEKLQKTRHLTANPWDTTERGTVRSADRPVIFSSATPFLVKT